MKRFFPIILCLICFLRISMAQTSGVIKDATTNEALTGATIIVKNTQIGTISDMNGHFSLKASTGATLVISYVGYQSKEVQITDASELNISLDQITSNLDQVVVLGTRSKGRVSVETPVPIDVVNTKQITATTAKMDLTSILNVATPSLNYNKQTGSDGADHIDLATLRGLGPDQSLVLINGKRRHQTAFISVFGTRGRGNSGTDLNAIPAAAIERVEVLRDGASAQYGSDAIAGVMNLVLKQNTGLTANVGYSAYYDNKFNPAFKTALNQYIYENKMDGATINANLNYGLKLGSKGGFLNLTGVYSNVGKTYRQSLNQDFNDEYGLPVNIYRRAHGDGSLNAFGGFANAELPLTDHMRVYAFGGYNNKESDAYAFTRNFSAKPERFITDDNGSYIPSDLIKESGDAETASADHYFNPHIQTHVKDFSGAVGLKGELKNNWDWDLSNVTGKNDFHFYGDKTFNASLTDINKNHFDDGGFSFLQNTTNLNLSRKFDHILSGFNLGTGLEYRLEQYELYAGEEASYKNYNPAKNGGSQGFPGYQPNDEVKADRNSQAFYLDGELDVTKKWLLDAAIRLENYSDFGFTDNYKLATRVKVTPTFNLRGSISTGFRAPSLQQINFSSTFTTVQGGDISEVKIAPNNNPITKAAGIPELKQERSLNRSIGFSFRPLPELSITYDFYNVDVKDRVVLSGQFDASDETLSPDLTNALKSLKVGLAQFFANAVNTNNKGVDMVIDYSRMICHHKLKTTLAANFQRMKIDKINVPEKLNDTEGHRKQFLSDREQAFILASAPNTKLALNLDYEIHKFNVGLRINHFGKVKILGYGEDALGINPQVPTDDGRSYVPDVYNYSAKWITDVYVGYKITKNLALNIGADNIFNIHPDLGAVKGAKWWAYNNETGGPWDAVQMGGNGLRLFGRLGFTF